MLKYNEQCLTVYQADKIGKPNSVNMEMTVGTIAATLTPVYVIIKPETTALPEKRLLTSSDASGVVVVTLPASVIDWIRHFEAYYVMIEKAGSGDLYDFQTSVSSPSGNAARVEIGSECLTENFSLKIREGAECLTC